MKEVIFISDLPSVRKPSRNGIVKTRRRCLCKCHCGKVFETDKDNFLNNGVRSCGCKQFAKRTTTHGMSKSKEYHCWVDMKMRCYNTNNKAFENYGGRGITVCERWNNSFESFLKDMGFCPKDKQSIDRLDVNGNYCKENCKWADFTEQANNKRNSRILAYNGKSQTLTQWAKELKVPEPSLRFRLKRKWSIERTLTTPIRKMTYKTRGI